MKGKGKWDDCQVDGRLVLEARRMGESSQLYTSD